MGEEQAFNPQPRGPGCCEVLLPWKRNKNLSMALASDECCHSITSIMNSNPSGSITDTNSLSLGLLSMVLNADAPSPNYFSLHHIVGLAQSVCTWVNMTSDRGKGFFIDQKTLISWGTAPLCLGLPLSIRGKSQTQRSSFHFSHLGHTHLGLFMFCLDYFSSFWTGLPGQE
jgi:hypothetical protein